ncbi:LamG domain-containing protein [Actinoplanes sp. TRM 88003]|uniref:LamG domain-containing protein n=1 Tax=Paractinoplanes aksuensis TaxID=2939490 RepID=A0ABT1E2X6_9ACTN|nr:LamG domain-containing protein [Actinoplanes aksuensis]MCO8277488.1 LamG domain-containing protein [Actinoplanes aksuensis]
MPSSKRSWIRGASAALALALVPAGSAVVVSPVEAQAAAAAPVCGRAAVNEESARRAASACGHPVPVAGSQSAYSQVLAQPDGRLTFESAVVPQRAPQADGSWADVDLTLRPDGGALRPAVSVADVAFSAGGSGPLVTLVSEGKRIEMSWPTPLPAPETTADTATYREVRPDVDLVLRATRTGFTHVLVVKSAVAATDPAVRRFTLGVSGDAALSRNPDGSLVALAGGATVATAGRAVMWDSAAPAPATRSATARSTAAVAGDTARRAAVATTVTPDGDLTLTPDARLLDAPGATFPIFIDPAWSVKKSKWAYATSNGCTNTDYTVARVGLSPEGPCTGVRFRSYFEFPTTAGKISLRAKHIESAYVHMKLDHSWSCDSTWAHMFHTATINATMRASFGIRMIKRVAAASGHANEGSGCSDSPQRDMDMNFIGGDVTSLVQSAATSGWTSLTMGFCACNENLDYESERDRWKKFFPNEAKLVVDYDSPPGKPTNLQVAGIACPASTAVTIGTLSPTFSAVYPDADTGQTLAGTYEWIEVPAAGMGAVTDTVPARKPRPAVASATANGRGTTAAVSVAKDKKYAFRVTARDPDPYARWSGWGAWCQFSVDTSVPPVSVVMTSPPTGPGRAATFRIESTAGDVATFKYGWTAPTTPVAATGTSPRSATITATVPRYGTNILYVSAVDKTLNEGYGTTEVQVTRPSPAVAQWGLESYPGRTEAEAMTDAQPLPGGSTPLTATNVTWTDSNRFRGGRTATFNGTSSSATTAGPIADTTQSFSVATWVRLGAMPSATDMKAVTQDHTDASGFELGVRRSGSPLVPYWSFVIKDTSAQTSTTRAALGTRAITAADVGRWVHLAGVYDKPSGTVRLFVDGKLAAETARTATPWSATGRLVVGRSMNAGSPGNWWNGSLADVQVFDRALVADDFTGRVADEFTGGEDEPGVMNPIEVGRWEFELARSCYLADRADTCDAADGTPFGRWLALSRGSEIGHGQRGSALRLDSQFFPDEIATAGEPTTEWARSAYKTGLTPPDDDGNQTTVWSDAPVLLTGQSYTLAAWAFTEDLARSQSVVAQVGSAESGLRIGYDAGTRRWEFALTERDAAGSARVTARSTTEADADVWTHLVAVYDTADRTATLYVDGEPEATVAVPWTPQSFNGPVTVGRSVTAGAPGGYLQGGVDDLSAFAGVLTDAQVHALYASQAVVSDEL